MRDRELKPPSHGVPPSPGVHPDESARDAFIEAEVERAVAPFVGLLPPEAIRAFKARAAAYLAMDPQMSRLLDGVFPQVGEQQSTARSVQGEDLSPGRDRRKAEKKA